MNVQYDTILAKMICGVIVQTFRCVLVNRFSQSGLVEVLQVIYGAAETYKMLKMYVSLTVHNPEKKRSGPL